MSFRKVSLSGVVALAGVAAAGSRATRRNVRRSRLTLLSISVVSLVSLLCGSQARSAVIISLTQDGQGDVTATATGTINTLGLTQEDAVGPPSGGIVSSTGQLYLGTTSTSEEWKGISGPTSWGTGGYAGASSNSGSLIGVVPIPADDFLFLPHGFTTGGSISGTSTWTGQSFTTLGITPGTYTYSWSGDSLTIQAQAAVPEPTTLAVLGIPAAIALLRRRRKLA